MKLLKKISRWFLVLLSGILLIFLVIWLALQFPSVQTKTVGFITKKLTEQLGTEVSIDRVDIDFFKTVSLEGIFIKDLQKDTLLYAGELDASLGILSIFKREIVLTQINLNEARVKLDRAADNPDFNFAFLIDAFASEDTVASENPWKFSIDAVSASNINFEMKDRYGGMNLNTFLGDFSVGITEMDLENQKLKFDRFDLKKTRVRFAQNLPSAAQQAEVTEDSTDSPLLFPYTGWDFEFEKIRIAETDINYTNSNNPTPIQNSQKGFNPNDVEIRNLTLSGNEVVWTRAQIKADLDRLAFAERSGFRLDNFSTEALVTSNQILLKNLKVNTPKSRIRNSTTVDFDSFAALTDDFENLQINSNFSNTKIAYSDLEVLINPIGELPFLNTDVERFMMLSGRVNGSLKNMKMSDFDLNITEAISLKIDGNAQNLTDVEQLQFDLNLREFSTSYEKAMAILKEIELPPGLKNFGTFNLTGKAAGKISDFQVEELVLKTDVNTGFDITGQIVGLPEIDDLKMNLVIRDFYTIAKDLEGFAEEGLPEMLDSLGQIQYVGKFDGTIKKFELDGVLQTDLGILESDIFMDFNESYTSANYVGAVRLNDFQLGKLLGDSAKIGAVTLKGDLKGSGFVLDSMEAEMKLVVENAMYADYDYENIVVDGFFKNKKFTGDLDLKDPNATLDFNGSVSLNDERPAFQFKMLVDTLNLQKLNLMESPLGIHAKMDINFTGNRLNDIEGRMNLTEIQLSNDSISFQSDSLKINATVESAQNRALKITSDFLNGSMEGDYNFDELNDLVLAYINEYFPIENLLTPSQDTVNFFDVKAPQKFTLFLEMTDHTPVQIFVPNLQFLENARLETTFNSTEKTLAIDGNLKKLMYDDMRFETINLTSEGNATKLNNLLTISDLNAKGGIFIPTVSLSNQLFEQRMSFELKVENDTIDQLIDLRATLNKPGDLYRLQFNKDMIVNNVNWQVNNQNFIDFDRNELVINDLIFSYENQQLGINSLMSKKEVPVPPIEIDFNNFQIKELSKIANIENVDFEGALSGKLTVIEPFDNLHYNADLTIPDFTLNEEAVGNFVAKLSQPAASQIIDVEVGLSGQKNQLEAKGDYDISTQGFNVVANLPTLELRLIDPLMAGIFGESRGSVNGKFTLKGTPEKPNLNGFVNLNEVSTVIDFTKTRYAIAQAKFDFDNSQINLGSFTLTDAKKNKANLSGKIKHRFFSDLTLDLNLNTNNFTFLNTTVNDNELFYGKLYLNANADISGPAEKPLVEVRAKTLENSVLNISAFAESDEFSEENYIIFGNPETYREKQEEAGATVYEIENNFPAEVRLNLELTDEATFRFIVDPVTGDMLDCKGNADLQINMSPSGAMEMFGSYVISSGQYRFSYSELVKRNFDITNGSSVVFNGDPLNARFNVTAKYATKTTPFELINSESSLSEAEATAAQRRQTVEVVLGMNGDLASPQLNFDIQLPEAEGSVFSSQIQRKLNELRNDQSALNTQVFGLLLFNSFMVSNSSTDFADTGESVILGSVSKFVSKQLNTLADKYIKGVQINFDVSSYKSQYANQGAGATVTEVGIGLTKNINDRLSVKAGGNFDVNADAEAASFSQLAGDFVLEYKLTETGNYLFKVFRKSDYDVLNRENSVKTGLGVSWKRAFGGKGKD